MSGRTIGRRSTLIIAGVVLFGVFVSGMYLLGRQQAQSSTSHSVQRDDSSAKQSPKADSLTFAAMGDMLAHDSVVAQAKTANGYDFKPYFTHIHPLYAESDVVFCNPETLSAGEQFGISGYPTFNAPTEFARDLVEGAGCDVVNMATNHINDKRQDAIDANISVWEKLKPLAFSGASRSVEEQNTVRYFTKNGIKVAFVAFADYSNDTNLTPYGLNIYHDEALVRRLVSEARRNADAVIVSAHWGTEDSIEVNDDQRQTATLFAQLGADVVIGTGPHVLQEAAYVDGKDGKKTLVWYSIGNMLSSQLKPDQLTGGVAGFTLTKSAGDVAVERPTFIPTFMSYDWPAAAKAADDLTARKNLKLTPLADAGNRPSDMFGPSVTVKERTDFVRMVIGSEAGVTITP